MGLGGTEGQGGGRKDRESKSAEVSQWVGGWWWWRDNCRDRSTSLTVMIIIFNEGSHNCNTLSLVCQETVF